MDRSKCERRITQKASRGQSLFACSVVVRSFLWLARTFRWKYEVNVSHADLGGSPQRHNHSGPSCNQDDAGLDRNPIWSPEDKRIAALLPVNTAEAQKAQSQVIFLENFSDELHARFPSATAIAFNPPNLP
jgi:hypothetical protein